MTSRPGILHRFRFLLLAIAATAAATSPARAEPPPHAVELAGTLGASYTQAIYGSTASADLGLSLLGRYGVVAAGGEYQFSDSAGDSSHYAGGLAGITLPFARRAHLFALASGGLHRVDKGFTYGTDLEGTTVSGDTQFDSPYAGGQLRLQLDFGDSRAVVVNVVGHARFDLDSRSATVSERRCVAIFCSEPMTETVQVGGPAFGVGVGIGYEL